MLKVKLKCTYSAIKHSRACQIPDAKLLHTVPHSLIVVSNISSNYFVVVSLSHSAWKWKGWIWSLFPLVIIGGRSPFWPPNRLCFEILGPPWIKATKTGACNEWNWPRLSKYDRWILIIILHQNVLLYSIRINGHEVLVLACLTADFYTFQWWGMIWLWAPGWEIPWYFGGGA